MVGIQLKRGQKVRLETPGGGGYGAALQRPVDRVARDVALGYVSRQAAGDDYGVVVADDGTVDAAATRARRAGRGSGA